MEKRLEPRWFEIGIKSYTNRMYKQDLNNEEKTLVESYARELQHKQDVKLALLVGLNLERALHIVINNPLW